MKPRLFRPTRGLLLGGFVTFRPLSGVTAIWVTARDARTMSAWNTAAAGLGAIHDLLHIGGDAPSGRLGTV